MHKDEQGPCKPVGHTSSLQGSTTLFEVIHEAGGYTATGRTKSTKGLRSAGSMAPVGQGHRRSSGSGPVEGERQRPWIAQAQRISCKCGGHVRERLASGHDLRQQRELRPRAGQRSSAAIRPGAIRWRRREHPTPSFSRTGASSTRAAAARSPSTAAASLDDTNVALLVSHPKLERRSVDGHPCGRSRSRRRSCARSASIRVRWMPSARRARRSSRVSESSEARSLHARERPALVKAGGRRRRRRASRFNRSSSFLECKPRRARVCRPYLDTMGSRICKSCQ